LLTEIILVPLESCGHSVPRERLGGEIRKDRAVTRHSILQGRSAIFFKRDA
jgi:hypothetical protein